MRRRGGIDRALLLLMLVGLLLGASAAPAATIDVPAQDGRLAEAIAAAAPGDVLRLAAGIHRARVVIDKPLTLDGGGQATVDAGGRGRVVMVTAPDAAIRGLTIVGSGLDQPAMDAGIFLDRTADRAVVENNHVLGNMFGIYVQGPKNALVQDNIVVGRDDLRTNEAGNGITVWNSPGTRILRNRICKGR